MEKCPFTTRPLEVMNISHMFQRCPCEKPFTLLWTEKPLCSPHIQVKPVVSLAAHITIAKTFQFFSLSLSKILIFNNTETTGPTKAKRHRRPMTHCNRHQMGS
jgi:hypothetical protein